MRGFSATNGIIGVNKKGQVLSVNVDEQTIIPYSWFLHPTLLRRRKPLLVRGFFLLLHPTTTQTPLREGFLFVLAPNRPARQPPCAPHPFSWFQHPTLTPTTTLALTHTLSGFLFLFLFMMIPNPLLEGLSYSSSWRSTNFLTSLPLEGTFFFWLTFFLLWKSGFFFFFFMIPTSQSIFFIFFINL